MLVGGAYVEVVDRRHSAGEPLVPLCGAPGGRDELEFGEYIGGLGAEVVAQRRRSGDEVWLLAAQRSPARSRRWRVHAVFG